jgi:glycosyltransferase involved in cell wall biosynthesis
MKFDVVLLTKDSMQPCLMECVESLYSSFPVNRLIVVDGGSIDGTIEYLSKFPDVEIHYDLNGNRATSRQLGIRLVETSWFLFLDSDCILSDGWFEKAKENLSSEVGALQGYDFPIYDKNISDFNESMISLGEKLGRTGSKALVPRDIRGFTGDALIRTETVKDIQIPRLLHVYEDYYIKKHIEKKGYKWLVTKDPCCTHINTRKLKDSYYSGYIGCRVGFLSMKRSLLATITIFPKVLYALILRRNLKMALWQIRFQLYILIGVLNA